jgi:hypothetical protein
MIVPNEVLIEAARVLLDLASPSSDLNNRDKEEIQRLDTIHRQDAVQIQTLIEQLAATRDDFDASVADNRDLRDQLACARGMYEREISENKTLRDQLAGARVDLEVMCSLKQDSSEKWLDLLRDIPQMSGRIELIKRIRENTGCELRAAKALCEGKGDPRITRWAWYFQLLVEGSFMRARDVAATILWIPYVQIPFVDPSFKLTGSEPVA